MTALRNFQIDRTTGAALGILVMALSGCFNSSTPSPNPDSETHFLTRCDESCGEGLSCICGVCTAVCDPASDCSGQHEDASCVSLAAFGDASCASEVDAASVCELECEGDDDCGSLSDTHVCDQGRCRAPALPGCVVDGVHYEAGETIEDRCGSPVCNGDGTLSSPPVACGPFMTCPYDGGVYVLGQTFPATDGCNTCTCTEGREVICTEKACPPSDGCEYNGTSYAVGDSFPSEDGCNTCSCGMDGNVACTTRGCLPDGCTVDGTTYEVGEVFDDPNGCGQCTCSPDGSVACDDVACNCTYDGKVYAAGESFPSSDGCNTCSCTAGGNVACTQRGCMEPIVDCESDFEAGDCEAAIPVYWFNPSTGTCEMRVYGGCGGNENRYDTLNECNNACGAASGGIACEVDGQRYADGENLPDPFSCNTCTCEDGALGGCTEAFCPVDCPEDTVAGSTCAQCGVAGGCDAIEIGCLPACQDDASCQAAGYFGCDTQAGHCVRDACL